MEFIRKKDLQAVRKIKVPVEIQAHATMKINEMK